MRVTEQIDALEVMGINSLNYLVLPKVIATIFFYPFLIVLAMFLGIFGGWVAGLTSTMFSEIDYMQGVIKINCIISFYNFHVRSLISSPV